MILYPCLYNMREKLMNGVFECCCQFYFPCACKGPVKQLYSSINMLDRINQWLTPCGVYKVADCVNFLNLAENPNGTSYNQCII